MNPLTISPWPVVGHDLAVARLARAVEGGTLAHAYLFNGLDHVGKRTLARTLAQALLCTTEAERPCGLCRACRLVAANRHPDFLTLDVAWQTQALPQKSSAQSVSVDAVRQMNLEVVRRPHEGRWKVLLVPQVEELTLAAANAFLKTLEEPPPFVVILLTTRDPDLLLPTIRSRCQSVPLFPLSGEQVAAALQARWGVEQERAALLARISGGRIGWAIRAAQEEGPMARRQAALDVLLQALTANRAVRLLLAAPLAKENDLEVVLAWASWWRDLLLMQHGASEELTNVDQRDNLQAAATRYTPGQAQAYLSALQRLLRLARNTNANPQLLWENLLLKLPHLAA